MLVNKMQGGDKEREIERRFLELYGLDPYRGHLNAQFAWDNMPNRKEVDERAFWGWRSSYTFKGEAWLGQIKTAEVAPDTAGKSYQHPEWGTLLLYLVDHSTMAGGGFAVVYCYGARDWNKEEDKPDMKSVRYFEWTKCDHEKHGWASKNTGNCLNRYTCKGCGYSYEVDSSD
jgi:hypothetical protein